MSMLWRAAAAAAALWNLAAFYTVLHDKQTARRNGENERRGQQRRVPEKRFMMFAATFGGIGVLTGFYGVRHKTKHRSLLVWTWVLTVLSYVAAAAIILGYKLFVY